MSGFDPEITLSGFIRVRRTGEHIKFQYNPETLNVESSVAWVKHKVPGIHHPRIQYAGGEGRTFTFSLFLVSEESGGQDIDEKISILESLTYPDVQEDSIKNREPSSVLLYLGGPWRTIPAVIDSVQITTNLQYGNLSVRYAQVDITATEYRVEAQGRQDVRL